MVTGIRLSRVKEIIQIILFRVKYDKQTSKLTVTFVSFGFVLGGREITMEVIHTF